MEARTAMMLGNSSSSSYAHQQNRMYQERQAQLREEHDHAESTAMVPYRGPGGQQQQQMRPSPYAPATAQSLEPPTNTGASGAMVLVSPTVRPVSVRNQLNVLELRGELRDREERQRSSFAAVLEQCYARVRRCASVARGDCTFEVPCMVMGLPLYDVERCVHFVLKHLAKNGFSVQYDGARLLQIAWQAPEESRDATAGSRQGGGGSSGWEGNPSDRCRSGRCPQPPQQQRQQQYGMQPMSPMMSQMPPPVQMSQPPMPQMQVQPPMPIPVTMPMQMQIQVQTRARGAEADANLQSHADRIQMHQAQIQNGFGGAKVIEGPSGGGGKGGGKKFMRSIQEFKPSGKFVLRV